MNIIFSQCVRLLGVVLRITFIFSSLECLFRLYIAVVRSKVEYMSVVWNSVTSTDANKLELIQQRFVALCFNHFFFHSRQWLLFFCFGGVKIANFTYQEALP
jgi:hypothetical protein